MNDFLELVAEVFEVEPEEVQPQMEFRTDLPDFSSMVGFSLIVMMEDEYGVRVPVEDFLECKTVADLYARVSAQ